MGFVSRKRGSLRFNRRSIGKKADIMHEIYFFLFQLILVFLVMVALFQFINNVATDLSFEKRFVSIDISLLSTAIFYAPGIIKQTYNPLPFKYKDGVASIEAKFGNSLVELSESGKEAKTYYWYLSDLTMDEFKESTHLEGVMKKVKLNFFGVETGMESEVLMARDVPFYKAGRNIYFNERNTNAYQLVCPVLNTSDAESKKKQVFLAQVGTKKDDAGSRLINIMDAQFSQMTSAKGMVAQQSILQQSGQKISGIPSNVDLVIAIGDSGEKKDPGALIVYVPEDSTILKSRKLACLIINHLLTPDSAVLYAQIMPVDITKLDARSPLSIFKEKAKPEQVMVFLEMGTFAPEQIEIRNTAQAISEAVEHYFGERPTNPVSGPTISVSYKLMQGAKQATGQTTGTTGTSATLASYSSETLPSVKPFGPVVDGITVQSDWGPLTLNPGKICDASRCDNQLKPDLAVPNKVNGRKILVIHSTVGASRRAVSNNFYSNYKKTGRRIAAQYVMGREGRYDMLTPETGIVWHTPGTWAGVTINNNAIGIETSNAEQECTKICYKVCDKKLCSTVPEAQKATLRPEEIKFWGAGNVNSALYEPYPPVQLRSLLELSCEIVIRYKIDTANVIRHLDSSLKRGSGHSDPGPMFPWRKFHADIVKCVQEYNQKAAGQTPSTPTNPNIATTPGTAGPVIASTPSTNSGLST